MVIYKRTPFIIIIVIIKTIAKCQSLIFTYCFLNVMTEDIKVYLMTNFESHWTLFLVIIAKNNRTIGLFREK